MKVWNSGFLVHLKIYRHPGEWLESWVRGGNRSKLRIRIAPFSMKKGTGKQQKTFFSHCWWEKNLHHLGCPKCWFYTIPGGGGFFHQPYSQQYIKNIILPYMFNWWDALDKCIQKNQPLYKHVSTWCACWGLPLLNCWSGSVRFGTLHISKQLQPHPGIQKNIPA